MKPKSMEFTRLFLIALFFSMWAGCTPVPVQDDPDPDPKPSDTYVFAIIGDYGNNSHEEGEVAELVKSWDPEFVITTGDNNYSDGEWETLEENIGQYYCDFIYNPDAPEELRCDGPAAQEKRNRFFPSLGNHDTRTENGAPYLSYFTLPGNERYYDFTWGPVHFFVLDSTVEDLECCEIEQAIWLKDKLSLSQGTFKIVYFHNAPYSVGEHGNDEEMQWPFEDFGADAVLTGHEHNYQRIQKKANPAFPYLVIGNSGKSDEDCFTEELDENEFYVTCIDGVHGALKVQVTPTSMIFQYFVIEDPSVPMDGIALIKS